MPLYSEQTSLKCVWKRQQDTKKVKGQNFRPTVIGGTVWFVKIFDSKMRPGKGLFQSVRQHKKGCFGQVFGRFSYAQNGRFVQKSCFLSLFSPPEWRKCFEMLSPRASALLVWRLPNNLSVSVFCFSYVQSLRAARPASWRLFPWDWTAFSMRLNGFFPQKEPFNLCKPFISLRNSPGLTSSRLCSEFANYSEAFVKKSARPAQEEKAKDACGFQKK